jgi:ATP-dependent Clp endopeptidase proteolytic subunit ClpP
MAKPAKHWTVVNINKDISEILLYGYIGPEEKVDCISFISELRNLEKTCKIINVRINSGGGDVFEGFAIYNALKQSKCTINTYVDGLAASMGSVLAMAGEKVFMSRNARMMIHLPKGGVDGDAQDMVNYAQLLTSLGDTLAGIFSDKCGKPVDQIKSAWMQKGVDKWLTADEALAENLVDEIYDGPVVSAPSNTTNQEELIKFYNQINPNQNTSEMKNYAKIMAMFAGIGIALPADGNEETVETHVGNLISTNKTLAQAAAEQKKVIDKFEADAKNASKEKVVQLVASAITAKKITAEMKEQYEKLATADFDSTKAILDKMAGYTPIIGQLDEKKTEDPERAKWNFSDYQKKDPAALAKMKIENKTVFSALFKGEYGVEPKLD